MWKAAYKFNYNLQFQSFSELRKNVWSNKEGSCFQVILKGWLLWKLPRKPHKKTPTMEFPTSIKKDSTAAIFLSILQNC